MDGQIVHSAQAADYNSDGLKDLIYSAAGGVNLALAPEFRVVQIAKTPPPLKPNSIYSTNMDVDSDGDMDDLDVIIAGQNSRNIVIFCQD